MSWTDERIALLKKLWLEGHSASQIAKQIGGTTRNAVIGKVHRLGLAGRAIATRSKKVTRPKPQRPPRRSAEQIKEDEQRMKAFREAAPTLEPLRLENGRLIGLLDLETEMCRWPIGKVGAPDFGFCGRHRDGEAVYCAHHRALAYQKRKPMPAGAKDEAARRMALKHAQAMLAGGPSF